MKTTLFLGLLLFAFLFTACDAEREAELTRPNSKVLSETERTSLATLDSEVLVFESVSFNHDPDGARLNYLQEEVSKNQESVTAPQTEQPQQKKKLPNPAQDTAQ